MESSKGSAKVSFLAFFLMWADRMKWEVPEVHIRACVWLESCGDLAVFRCFRGFGKSTLLGVYNAWRLKEDPAYRILHQSESDPTAYKTSRDTQQVLNRHSLTKGLFRDGGVEQWWARGNEDARNGSFYARGILSNVTSARCDEAQNDDIEVPRNIRTPEAREQLEYRLGEQNFILAPGGRQLFVGTPHTHDSIYDKMEALGADCLTIPLFANEHRIEIAKEKTYRLSFAPEYVFKGTGKGSRLMAEGRDYTIDGNTLIFDAPPGCLIDCYRGCAWPERFTRLDLEKRRKKTKTVNYWDSQYQLHSKPVGDIRLDPAIIKPYDVQPVVSRANKELRMMLGKVQIISARANWDCATGKIGGDDSAFSLILDDAFGNNYWHVCTALTGEYAEFADSRNTKIIGGQVMQACALVKKHHIPSITVETNGVGSFSAKLLRRALKQEGLQCAVLEQHASGNKNERILAGLEPPMRSGTMWAHVDVLNGPMWDQMKDWKPDVKSQPDDYLDSGAGAVLASPVRIGKMVGNPSGAREYHWQPNSGVFELTLEEG